MTNDTAEPKIDEAPIISFTTLHERVCNLWEHKDCQIDENRKISRRVDELEKDLYKLENHFMKKIGYLEGFVQGLEHRIKALENEN